ncbi:mycothiol transferase [Micromonosporaceae bacterium Da 78-11]
MDAKDILADGFGRLPDLVHAAVHDLTAEQLRWAPAEGANSIGWLVWHLTRVQDHHLSPLVDAEQVYLVGDWAPKFGLEPDPSDIGYGHTAAQVAAVTPRSAAVLEDYYRAVHERTIAYLGGLTAPDLDRVVDKDWDPPVTLGVRLGSVLNDDAQHVGQAAYVRGLL